VAPAAQHPPLARRARRRLAVRAGPGCRRCRASALGALQVAGCGRQGGRRRRWKRACRRPPARASRGREARRATRWPGVCQGRRAGRGYQREPRAGRREKWLYFSYTLAVYPTAVTDRSTLRCLIRPIRVETPWHSGVPSHLQSHPVVEQVQGQQVHDGRKEFGYRLAGIRVLARRRWLQTQ
jgi:hypothetical protein